VQAAEACGGVRYLKDGVMFVGMDLSGGVRSATVRFLSSKLMPDGSRLTKRDLSGTDKAFPVIFEGDPDRIVVVEGAVSGLAAQSLSALAGRTQPTAIVTGGVSPLRWISEPNSKASVLVRAAPNVTILAENELGPDGKRDEVKQERTDAARAKIVDTLFSVRNGSRPRIVYPPEFCKDAADWLVRAVNSRP